MSGDLKALALNILSHYIILSIGGIFTLLVIILSWGRRQLCNLFMIPISYQNQQEAEKDIYHEFNNSKTLKILAIRGLGIIGLKDSLLRNLLLNKEKDLELKILLLSPTSDYLKERARQISETEKSFQEGIKLSIQEILELKKQARCKIDIKLFNERPLWRLFIFDSALFIGTFIESTDSRKTVHQKLAINNPLFSSFNSYFNYIWNEKSVPIEEHLLKEIRRSYYVRALEFLTDNGCSQNIIRHSIIVSDLSVKIAENLRDKDYPGINILAVELGALLHDIGKAKSSNLDHGYIGGEMIRNSMLIKDPALKEKIATIVESHVGVGFTKDEVEEINKKNNLNIPEKDYLPDKIEAEIVAYVDKLVEQDEKPYSEKLEEKKGKFGPESRFVKTFEKWHQEFYKYYKK